MFGLHLACVVICLGFFFRLSRPWSGPNAGCKIGLHLACIALHYTSVHGPHFSVRSRRVVVLQFPGWLSGGPLGGLRSPPHKGSSAIRRGVTFFFAVTRQHVVV